MTRRPTTSQRIEIRHGRWEDVLSGLYVDSVISDPPYGDRTHTGQEEGADGSERQAITYASWTPYDVERFVAHWSPRAHGWMACLTSHDLIPAWEQAYTDAGRYAFAPVPIVCENPAPRMVGDGPTSGAVYLMAARPRSSAYFPGSLPGHYRYVRPPGAGGGGRGKPVLLMEAIVRDYTRRGELVCDPCAGWGSTLQAARVLGRRAIGAEVDSEAFAEACRRIDQPYTPDLLGHAVGE